MAQHDATRRQVLAANPETSTWLSANAGSGKTSVLIDRVARLLLGGTSPTHILCLTYTKAAASEMQNRLFARLGAWAMLPDARLQLSLTELGLPGPHDAQTLARARRLFARAIETPGGLRIQTIHSFCASLLRRFPLEAGVSPQFKEVDDRSARLLRAEIVQEMADGLAPQAVTDLGMIHTGADFDKLLAEIAAIDLGHLPLTPQKARDLFSLPPGETLDAVLHDVFLGDEAEILAELESLLPMGTATEAKLAPKIAAVRALGPVSRALDALEKLFLFGADARLPFGAKIDAFPTKDLRNGPAAALMPRLNALMSRVEAARPRRVALAAAAKTATLYHFANAFLPRYAARKAARGWLDFDDLIGFTTRLLSNPGVAAWVLYRLDGGINHILVDEAQDTSPAQWRVIEALAAEFTSGDSAHEGARTLFVVGDKKQSIYSFQGANVAIFDQKRDRFAAAFLAAEQLFQPAQLEYSFRSSPAILDLVDQIFGEPAFARAMGDLVYHVPFRDSLPGRVELWPDIPTTTSLPDRQWEQAVDLITPQHHAAQLAQQVADRIKTMLDCGFSIQAKGGPRAVHPGDFLILVQGRSTLFAELIRACKRLNLPIAGADRLKLAAEIAVTDLTSLLACLATPEDDLALAETLRSPLFGLSEADLYRLAHGRPGYLWQALRDHRDDFSIAFDIFTDLRDKSDFLRPYDLLERILVTHDGRKRLLTRLGDEAEEGIDAFLQQALDYETAEVPSLTGFLIWLQDDAMEIKRQTDAAGHRIRIMTVHGAKGLESEIVILPDCADHPAKDRDTILDAEGELPMWAMPAGQRPPAMERRTAARKDQMRDEKLRLLYVALTRARCLLIVAAAGDTKTALKGSGKEVPKDLPDLCWYRLVERGLSHLNPVDAGPLGRVHAFGAFPDPLPPAPPSASAPDDAPDLPDWASAPHNAPAAPLPALSPSDLGGAKALPGDEGADSDSAKQRGTALHLLLEHLPEIRPELWPRAAASLIADETLCARILDEATTVLTNPDLKALFAPGSLAEVALTGDFGDRRLHGSIDRLILTDDAATFIDFKSNRLVPASPAEVPEGLLRQMGAYAHLLAQIYPGRRLCPAILWTSSAQLMPLDPDIVRDALSRATIP